MLDIQDVFSAIDRAREELAQCQYDIAKKSPVSGNPGIFDDAQIRSLELSMYLDVIEMLTLHTSVEEEEILENMTAEIKRLTKDLRQWD